MDLTKIDESTFNLMLDSVKELADYLALSNIPLILGGGLSLFIRTSFLTKQRSPRYEFKAHSRSTKDIDIYLTGDIITDRDKQILMRDALRTLGYTDKTKYFQFTKEFSNGNTIDLDILAPQKTGEKDIRVRLDIKKLHARSNSGAEGVNIGIIPVPRISKNLYLVSAFNFIILKLHAFRDRINDPTVDMGRYHAYDIFSTILDMDENDWIDASKHYLEKFTEFYICESQEILKKYFHEINALGLLRLQENELYKRDKIDFDPYLPDFISDLNHLFFL